jgi:hypothetical protein
MNINLSYFVVSKKKKADFYYKEILKINPKCPLKIKKLKIIISIY